MISYVMRTVSPSVHPLPASGGATDLFLASALPSPPNLAIRRRERRAMRLIDFCHPIELRVPTPRVFPARSRHFRGGDALRSLGLRRVDRGTERFTTFEDRFGGSSSSSWPHDGCLTAFS
jgi:hypothetical protein